jgi:hypothetical protein
MNSTISVNGSALCNDSRDALENIVMTAQDTITRYRQLDVAQVGNWNDTALESSTEHVEDQLAALETLASSAIAGTATGALFQVVVAIKDAHKIENITEEPERAGELKPLLRRLNRNLYALLAYIESTSPLKHGDLGFDFYFNPVHNPFHEPPKLTAYLKEIQQKQAVVPELKYA